jgi:hypothetical protein
MWLKDKYRWSKTQIVLHHDLSRRRLKTARSFRMKEELRDSVAEASTRAQTETLPTA